MNYKVSVNNKEYIIDLNKRNVEYRNNDSDKVSGEHESEIRKKIELLFCDDKDETFNIRKYLVENPEVAIVIIPAITAGLAFVAGTIEFVMKYQYVSYWDISTDYISISGIMPFIMAIVIVLVLLIELVPKFFFKEFECISLYYGARYVLKRNMNYIFRIHKQSLKAWESYKKTHKAIVRANGSAEELKQFEKIEQEERVNNEIFNLEKRLSRFILKKFIWAYIKILIVSYIFMLIIYNVFVIMLGGQAVNFWIPLIYTVLGLSGVWIRSGIKYKWKIAQLIKRSGMDFLPEDLMRLITEKVLDKVSEVRRSNRNIFDLFSDENCKKFFGLAMAIVVISIASVGIMNYYYIRQQKRYDITVIDGDTYAVMMNVDGQYLLKPIHISKDKKTANIESEALRIEGTSLNMRKMAFERVVKK